MVRKTWRENYVEVRMPMSEQADNAEGAGELRGCRPVGVAVRGDADRAGREAILRTRTCNYLAVLVEDPGEKPWYVPPLGNAQAISLWEHTKIGMYFAMKEVAELAKVQCNNARVVRVRVTVEPLGDAVEKSGKA